MNAYEYIKGCDIGQKRKFVIVKVIRNVYERVTVFLRHVCIKHELRKSIRET